MGLIPGFEYDIFISYAHIDNATIPGQADGWIEQFYKNLNLLLAKRFGRMDMVKIWWDSKKLDGSVLFDDSIAEGIEKTAIMICLNSPGYQASKYCQKELDIFYHKAQNEPHGLKIVDRSRLVHVLLNNISYTDWPQQLSGTSGFMFHDAKESTDFGDPVDTLSVEFKNQLQNLRDALWYLITDFIKLKDKQNALSSIPTAFSQPENYEANKQNDDTFTIYLGEVADTLRSQRKRIITEIEKKGFKVVTGIPPPDEVTAHEKATLEAVKKSHLSVHLLDEFPGREIVGAPELWYPQKQAEISLQNAMSSIIWIPAEANLEVIEDADYKKFLSKIESGEISQKNYEFIRSSKSSVAQEIIDLASQLNAKRTQSNQQANSLSVLLDTHFNDQMHALDLSKILLENHIQPFINPQEDDPRKNIHLLGDRMSQVRKLIFLYGNVSKEWVLERMSAALQLIITNNYPIEDFFIYMAPPHKESNEININQRFLKVNVVDGSNAGANEAVINQFLNELKTPAK